MLAALVALPDDLAVLLRDRFSRIDDRNPEPFLKIPVNGEGDGLAVRCVINGIIKKIAEYLAHFQGIRADQDLLGTGGKDQMNAVLCRAFLTVVDL